MMNKDNRGLTLVELLVSVVILAVVLIPISHSFVSSYTVNAKSRQALRATTLAQNEMELFEKEKIDSLKDTEKFNYTVTENDPAEGAFKFSREDVVNGPSDQAKFDVYVSLEPKPFTTVYEKDSVMVNTLSALDSGRFIQTVPVKNNKTSMDKAAYKEFLKLFPEKTIEDIEKETKRSIILDINQKDETDGKKSTQAVLKVVYKLGDKQLPVHKEIIFNNSESKDKDGNRIPLKSVYIFYAPRYKATSNDVITINNNANIKTDIYVIRQDMLNADFSAKEPLPATYKATLIIKDATPSARYFTNLNFDGKAASASKGEMCGLKLNGINIGGGAARAKAIKKLQMNDLAAKTEKNRYYEMKVEVFKADADPTTESPLASLTGTKLE